MKKFMILAAGVVLMSSAANAQSSKAKANKVASENILSKPNQSQYFSLGPIAGFGHSWVSGMHNSQFKPAGYLGISLVYSKLEHWGFGADLSASHEGFKTDYVRNNTVYTTSIDPTYLRLTPKAYYFFGQYGDNIRPKIFLGPSLGIKLAEDQYTNDNKVYYESGMPVATTDFFKPIDLGVEVGGGVNFKVAKHIWFNVDASYYNGLTYATDMDNMNRNLKLNAALMLGL